MARGLAKIPVSDLRDDVAGVLARVRGSRRPVVIVERGRAAAVMLGAEAFERAQTERELLRQLARGDREIAEGRGFDLDAVLAESGRRRIRTSVMAKRMRTVSFELPQELDEASSELGAASEHEPIGAGS